MNEIPYQSPVDSPSLNSSIKPLRTMALRGAILGVIVGVIVNLGLWFVVQVAVFSILRQSYGGDSLPKFDMLVEYVVGATLYGAIGGSIIGAWYQAIANARARRRCKK